MDLNNTLIPNTSKPILWKRHWQTNLTKYNRCGGIPTMDYWAVNISDLKALKWRLENLRGLSSQNIMEWRAHALFRFQFQFHQAKLLIVTSQSFKTKAHVSPSVQYSSTNPVLTTSVLSVRELTVVLRRRRRNKENKYRSWRRGRSRWWWSESTTASTASMPCSGHWITSLLLHQQSLHSGSSSSMPSLLLLLPSASPALVPLPLPTHLNFYF